VAICCGSLLITESSTNELDFTDDETRSLTASIHSTMISFCVIVNVVIEAIKIARLLLMFFVTHHAVFHNRHDLFANRLVTFIT